MPGLRYRRPGGAHHFIVKLRSRLPWVTQEVLTNELDQIGLIAARLQRIDAVVQERAARRPEVALLMTIRGMDVLSAFTVLAMIGPIDRFATPGSLVNYAGLVPRQHSSAGSSHFGRITKAGSKMLRWAIAEAVQSLCRQDGPYRNLCKRLERRKKAKGVAMAACGRKLLEAIWHMLTNGETFRHMEPDLVERKVRRRDQRLEAARLRLAQEKDRHKEFILSQLALVQDLAQRRTKVPVPRQLLATFGRLPIPPTKALAG